MTAHEWIAILDFGSQYTQLIARRIREQHVYSEIVPFSISARELKDRKPSGIVLSGSPASVFDDGAPFPDEEIFKLGVPVLGICYGMQCMTRLLDGRVKPGRDREYGHAVIDIVAPQPLFNGLPDKQPVWMSHGDQIETMPEGFEVMAKTPTCPVAACANKQKDFYGVQFHPEVVHTEHGRQILSRFIFDICKCAGNWEMSKFVEKNVACLKEKIGSDDVVCGLSGGVDSSVVAALIHKAIGNQLHCIFVNNGLLRKNETEEVEKTFGDAFGMDLHVIDAEEQFLENLEGVTDPEKKRKIIGKTFIDVFSKEAKSLGKAKYLAQGTLYPDVIESVSPLGGPSVTIKTHHNVGGLPEKLHFSLIEPVRELFKDEVRELGRELGLPEHIVNRQPFPGPGLAVRILGAVTAERVKLLQEADQRVQEEISKLENYSHIWQSFAVLLPIQTVGVMGDGRTYENVIALRVVESRDAMTADWSRLPYDTLARISNRIINEVRGVNRVVYDISSKPPSTIEWE
jgi:GMP synthase (glutamine-hydrolysing)